MANTKRRTAAAKWGAALTLAVAAAAQGASPARDPSGKPPNAAAVQSGSRFDARRLRTGRFEYLTLDHGKVVGKGCLTIRRLGDGTVAFTDDETGAFAQHWEARATASLAPLTAALCFTQGAHAVSMNLIYRGDQVTGTAARDLAAGAKAPAIRATLPPVTIDQRIDWAAVLASRVQLGAELSFNVYDPWTGASQVSGQATKLERASVPAGAWDAYRVSYRVKKPKGWELYQLMVSKDEPHLMIREEFPDGSVSELTGVSATDGSRPCRQERCTDTSVPPASGSPRPPC
ncbi:MAG TPA: hypothetical protein VHG32_27515 [Thermoanaerobaculia bacterium]|nr:hypothetical protein [Thermoanaerobaculia bacterium]